MCAGQFYEGFNKEGKESMLPYGVYTMDDLKQYGADRNWCPYFLSRFAVSVNWLMFHVVSIKTTKLQFI